MWGGAGLLSSRTTVGPSVTYDVGVTTISTQSAARTAGATGTLVRPDVGTYGGASTTARETS